MMAKSGYRTIKKAPKQGNISEEDITKAVQAVSKNRKVKLVWATPEAEKIVLYCMRVSSKHQNSTDTNLLGFGIREKHWSPFEMANMCLEFTTSRAVSAQLIRHKSFAFQEFSQRYAVATEYEPLDFRLQDKKNRQNSLDELTPEAKHYWDVKCQDVVRQMDALYHAMLKDGIAKECARGILPMTTQTKVYVNGTLRSWIHYFDLRCDKATQLEHRRMADDAKAIFYEQFPIIGAALDSHDRG